MKLKLLGLAALLLVPGLATSAYLDKAMAASASLTALDPDNDGTVDLQEAKAAAAKLFTKLDPDNDGTLDAKELSGRVDEAELKAADADNDGTLDQKEYEAIVEARFKAANPDDDGTLDEKELRRIGFPWSAGLVERTRRSVGGTLGASRAALRDGLAANLAGGTHHAYPEHGATGLPGLVFLVLSLVLLPLGDIRRALARPEQRPLARFYIRCWLFGLYLSSVETLLSPLNPVWFLTLQALFGLVLLGTYRLRAPATVADAAPATRQTA